MTGELQSCVPCREACLQTTSRTIGNYRDMELLHLGRPNDVELPTLGYPTLLNSLTTTNMVVCWAVSTTSAVMPDISPITGVPVGDLHEQ